MASTYSRTIDFCFLGDTTKLLKLRCRDKEKCYRNPVPFVTSLADITVPDLFGQPRVQELSADKFCMKLAIQEVTNL